MMFGHEKKTATAAVVKSEQPAAHAFDQTNGVLKEYDLRQSRLRGEDPTLLDYDSAEQKGRLFSSGAIGGMLGGNT